MTVVLNTFVAVDGNEVIAIISLRPGASNLRFYLVVVLYLTFFLKEFTPLASHSLQILSFYVFTSLLVVTEEKDQSTTVGKKKRVTTT